MGRRKPALDEPFHPFPRDAPLLASPSKDVMPEVAHPEPEVGQGVPVSRHSKVSDMPAHNGLQPCADFRDGVMHASPQFGPCVPGSQTAQHPAQLAMALSRMLPSALCQSVGVLKFGVFRGSITWPVVPPVNASYLASRPCPHDSEPVWFATPSPYDSFIRYILPARCGLHHVLQSGCYCV
jgi:hypothetical protein